MVDIDGAKDKYREDYNLRSGFRLFTLDVDGRAKAPDATRLDRFHIDVDTPGDEPVSHFRLTAADRTLYDLRADFTRSKYFYQVPQLFEAPVAGDVRLDDLHDWNFVRTNGVVDLRVHPPGLPTLFFGYRLYERHGDAKSTVRIRAGDTFVVPAPVDSTTQVGRVGTEFTALDTNVFLEQEYRHVGRRPDLGPSGPRAGVDPTDASRLTFFDADEDDHIDIPATTVRLRRALGERAELTGAYYYSHADLGFDSARRSVGTVDVGGAPAPTASAARGGGDATLDTHVADAGASVQLAEHVRLETSYRLNDRSENGTLDETSTFGTIAAVTGDHVRTHSVTSSVAVRRATDLSLDAGFATRGGTPLLDQRTGHLDRDDRGDRRCALAAVVLPRPLRALRERADRRSVHRAGRREPRAADPGAADRPHLHQPGDGGPPGHAAGLADGQLPARRGQPENDTFAARSQSFGNSAGLTVSPLPDLTIFASYTRRDLSDDADIRLAPSYTPRSPCRTAARTCS
jgi:hypothetical protein